MGSAMRTLALGALLVLASSGAAYAQAQGPGAVRDELRKALEAHAPMLHATPRFPDPGTPPPKSGVSPLRPEKARARGALEPGLKSRMRSAAMGAVRAFATQAKSGHGQGTPQGGVGRGPGDRRGGPGGDPGGFHDGPHDHGGPPGFPPNMPPPRRPGDGRPPPPPPGAGGH